MSQDMEADVKELFKKFSILVAEKPRPLGLPLLEERYKFLAEELAEFWSACHDGDFPGQADALIDLVYVAIGTGVLMGLPWKVLWDDVQRANMAKERGIGKRGNKVDLVKPKNWVPPQTELILLEASYDPADWQKTNSAEA